MEEYVKRKAGGGLRKVTVKDIMETLGVNRTTASVIFERLMADPHPLIEAIAERLLERLNSERTTADLSKEMNIDRWWISKAVELLSDRGLAEVKSGRVRRSS